MAILLPVTDGTGVQVLASLDTTDLVTALVVLVFSLAVSVGAAVMVCFR